MTPIAACQAHIIRIAEKNNLSIVNLGLTPKKGIYWDIPRDDEQTLTHLIPRANASALFKDDLETLSPAGIIIIDHIAQQIITASIEFLEEISPLIPSSVTTKWLYQESHFTRDVNEIFEKHLQNSSSF
jgi:hypothetical protein